MQEMLFEQPEDICAHAGEDYRSHFGAMSPPIFQTSLFAQQDGEANPYLYSRLANPTVSLCEEKLALLEHAEKAVLFSSGMGAISAAISSSVKAGDHVIMVRSAYGPAKGFLDYLSRFGVSCTLVEGSRISDYEAAARENTRLIYLETPSTFLFGLQDLAQVAEFAKSRGIRTIADNTWATPVFQNPLDFGIDLVVHSASKYLGGHSDILGGVVAGSKELAEPVALYERQLYGAVMDPHQAWLLMRGLRTLPLRMRQHMESGMEIARFLEGHPKIERVLYPGLPAHPQYELGRRQMKGYSGVMSFVTKGTPEQNDRLLAKIKIFQKGVSWGGYDSLISGPGVHLTAEQSQESGMPVGLIRISVGLEHLDSLKEALDAALGEIS